ncbi:uncharacterized protein BO97DRAFT_183859 [Aspergillus homomorphus CBS 101889]|uniref:Uncharacterized protein n=1 Tax=Aspergillus homomorphus (strain CBS 101889) TaxID=1450537 RepID=A0A395IA94_ASPHC|nr:hypothetical protein BO97DRAFT_183859 [Aspergillus homomorphus CBS 101889]RAL16133.1 hypothetical protein BO97DRAFT_183859 [Aspergillus homomorphus CBS 101889]
MNMNYTLKKSQTHCVVLAAHSAEPKVAASQPRAAMATVSMTSELEPYLASLRSYLAQSRPPHGADAEPEDSAGNTTHPRERQDLRREQTSSEWVRDNRRPGPRQSVLGDPPRQAC